MNLFPEAGGPATRSRSACRRCGAPVVFIETSRGTRHIVDAAPRLAIVTDAGEVVTGRQDHHATCDPEGER
jgi:hypothetical protein